MRQWQMCFSQSLCSALLWLKNGAFWAEHLSIRHGDVFVTAILQPAAVKFSISIREKGLQKWACWWMLRFFPNWSYDKIDGVYLFISFLFFTQQHCFRLPFSCQDTLTSCRIYPIVSPTSAFTTSQNLRIFTGWYIFLLCGEYFDFLVQLTMWVWTEAMSSC